MIMNVGRRRISFADVEAKIGGGEILALVAVMLNVPKRRNQSHLRNQPQRHDHLRPCLPSFPITPCRTVGMCHLIIRARVVTTGLFKNLRCCTLPIGLMSQLRNTNLSYSAPGRLPFDGNGLASEARNVSPSLIPIIRGLDWRVSWLYGCCCP